MFLFFLKYCAWLEMQEMIRYTVQYLKTYKKSRINLVLLIIVTTNIFIIFVKIMYTFYKKINIF